MTTPTLGPDIAPDSSVKEKHYQPPVSKYLSSLQTLEYFDYSTLYLIINMNNKMKVITIIFFFLYTTSPARRTRGT